MSFSTLFGGNLVAPAIPTYLSLSFGVNTILGWPLESSITNPIAAEIIDCTATAGGLTLQLSDARQISNGYCALFNNIGANTFTVLDAQGNVLMSPASGQAWQLYLADNSTLQGTWRVFQYGAGVSNANAASLAGAGLKAITTTLNERIVINAQSSTYNIVNGDRATCIEWTSGTGTFNLPNPATVGSDWFVYIKNSGSGTLSLVAAGGGTIDGLGNLPFLPNNSAIVLTDGTNFFSVGFGQSIASSFNFISIDASGSGNLTLNASQQNKIAYKFTGTLTGARTIVIPGTVQQYWVDNETAGAFTLTVSTGVGTTTTVAQGFREILYCDGTNVLNATTVDPSQIAVLNAVSNTFTGQVISTQAGTAANSGFYANSSSPSYGWRNSSGGTDAKVWDAEATATDLIFRAINDAGSTVKAWLDVTRSGVVVTALAFGNATDNPTYGFLGTGTATFSGAVISSLISGGSTPSLGVIAAGNAQLDLKDTSQALDTKTWRIQNVAAQLTIQTENDAYSVARVLLNATRTAAAITAITFGNATDNPSFTFAGTGAGSVAGTWTFSKSASSYTTGGLLLSGSGNMLIGFFDSSQSANNRAWQLFAGGGQFMGASVSDDGSTSRTWLTVSRSGAALSVLQFGNSTDTGASYNIYDESGAAQNIGFRGLPQNSQSANYQLVLADRGKSIHNGTAGTLTLTIPANSSVAFPIGTAITITTGSGGGGWTIQITTDTLVWSASGATGTRTLAGNGSNATLLKIGATQWLINGVNLS